MMDVNTKEVDKGGVFALGNFDGVHKGHRLVLDAAMAKARSLAMPAKVLTFEPHPREFFQPHGPFFRLTSPEAKARALKACGIETVVTLPFTPAFAQLSAQDFVEQVLARQLGAQHIVAGHDFVFGHKRSGDMRKLEAWLAPYDIGVTEIEPFGDGTAFSSTRIREFLQQGRTSEAAHMLGRDWSIAGTVIKGAQRGRTIGIPTANISLGTYLRPKFGVYAVNAGQVGKPLAFRGVANIGVRPTVDGQHEYLEAHLFDFASDIYGQEWEFALKRFIRPEQKFEGLEALKTQIIKDIEAAKLA